MNRAQLARRVSPFALSLGVLGLGARDASACGGLFCSASAPVNQAAERIIFAFDAEARQTTAVVEILYQGPSQSFAWLLPVPGTPELGLSSSAQLNRLQQLTNPNYQIQRSWSGDGCGDANFGGQVDVSVPDSPQSSGGEGQSAVSVLAAGTLGPYDYRVIDVADDFAGDPAQEALDWLTDNGYDVTATTPDLLRPYLEEGMNLAAVRLQKNADSGSIRPIRISYESDQPMIPIRPTAVAANRDMGILVWVLGASRAVPTNYKTLELNEALIDWFNPQQSYDDVVIAAANEAAGGQGFVTELARRTTDPNFGSLSDGVFPERFNVDEFRQTANGLSDEELLVRFATWFSSFSSGGGIGGPFAAVGVSGQVALDGVSEVLSEHVGLPPGVSIDDVLASPECFISGPENEGDFYCNGQRTPEQTVDLTGFDRAAFLSDAESDVFEPLEETSALFNRHPYVTRFYTTLSPDEMTVDPCFDLNADLPEVDNVHRLALEYEGCPGDTSGPWQAEVAGRLVRGQGSTWPLSLQENAGEMPVNLRILQLSPAGPGLVEEDNRSAIESLLGTRFADDATPDGRQVIRSSGGCALSGAGALDGRFAALSLLGLAVALARLRRRAG